MTASADVAYSYPSAGRARYALIVLTLLGFLLMTDITLTALLMEPMKHDMGLTDVEVALVQGTAFGLALGLGSLPMGRLIDRVSRKLLIALSLVGWMVALTTIGLASTVPVLVAARVLLGLVAALVVPAAFSMAADVYPAERRSVATSILVAGQALGQGFGILAGGLAFDALTRAGVGRELFGLAPWRLLYLAAASFGVLLLLLLVPLREPQRHERQAEGASTRAALRELWSYRGLLFPLIAGLLFAQVTIQAASVWASPLLIRRGLTPGEFAGWLSAVLLAGGILGALAGGRFAELGRRRYGQAGVLLPGVFLALVVAPASLFAIAQKIPLFAGLLAINIFGGAVVATVGVIALTLVIPNNVRGLALGMSTFFSATFAAAGAPAAIAVLSNALGGENELGLALVLVCVPSALLSALCTGVAVNSVRRNERV